jgi:hypothetical protein
VAQGYEEAKRVVRAAYSENPDALFAVVGYSQGAIAERGVEVEHVTVYRWVRRFTPLVIDAARPCRHACGDRWFVEPPAGSSPACWARPRGRRR